MRPRAGLADVVGNRALNIETPPVHEYAGKGGGQGLRNGLADVGRLGRHALTVVFEDDRTVVDDHQAVHVRLGHHPGERPVLAATAEGDSKLYGGGHLKFKESNRIATTVSMLKNLGVDVQATNDGCTVKGKGKIRGGNVRTELDHRIMMSAIISGLVSDQGVTIDDSTSYSVSYPAFMDDIQKLGAIIQLVKG